MRITSLARRGGAVALVALPTPVLAANGTRGSYTVVASLHSTPVRTAAFSLTNTP